MKKKSSIVKLSIIGVLIVIGMVLSFCSFNVGFSTYNSFASSIQRGLDLDGGIYALYEANPETDSLNVKMENAKDGLYSILTDKGHTSVSVSKEGEDRLKVQLSDSNDTSTVSTLLSELGQPLTIKYVIESTGTEILTSEHVVGAEVNYNNGYIVVLRLNNAGKKILNNNSKSEMHIITTTADGTEETKEVEVVGSTSYITGLSSNAAAATLANQILSGSLGVSLSLVETYDIQSPFGDKAPLLALLTGIIALVFVMLFIAIKYRLLGVVTAMNILIFGILMLFLMAVFPWLELSLAGVIALFIGFAVLIDGNITIFDRIKDEYANGKSIVSSTHYGFKKSRRSILDGNIIVLLAAIFFAFLPVGTLKAFGFVLLGGAMVSIVCSLFITRKLAKYFFAILDKKPELLTLARSAEYAGLGADQTAGDVQKQIDAELNEKLRLVKEKENDKPLKIDNSKKESERLAKLDNTKKENVKAENIAIEKEIKSSSMAENEEIVIDEPSMLDNKEEVKDENI